MLYIVTTLEIMQVESRRRRKREEENSKNLKIPKLDIKKLKRT